MCKWGFFIVLSFLLGCSQSPKKKSLNAVSNFQSDLFEVKKDSVFTYTFNHEVLSSLELSSFRKVVLLSTPFYAYVEKLGAENKVVGLFNKSRVGNVSDSIMSIGEGSEIDIERIISLNPDLIICNSYQLEALESIRTAKLLVDDFNESSPLCKASVINLFGAVFSKRVKSKLIFDSIVKSYAKPDFLDYSIGQLNNFGGVWYQPGCETYLANLVKDAGLQMNCVDGRKTSVVLSQEEALVAINNSDYLLFFDWKKTEEGLNDRLTEARRLSKNNLKIIYCNTYQSEFFQKSILMPGKIINDLNKVVKTKKEGEFFKIINLEK
ncbi:MAG: ABC-type Fe3+-hydroxamate transport system substrate-binding protein [Flavobacteriales bacterium]|jgi:ABC-type Fe3+-hydroxamate transport system substrate-binding protein|tara:strand:- start:1531 stop:2499 length:969 start_codon:yes stop_codon:yes gene_type:complete